jgi:hypothetical protein
MAAQPASLAATHFSVPFDHLGVSADMAAHVASSEPAATQVLAVLVEQTEEEPVLSEFSKHATQLSPSNLGVATLMLAQVASLIPAATHVPFVEEHTLVPLHTASLVQLTQANPFHSGRSDEQRDDAFILFKASMLAV